MTLNLLSRKKMDHHPLLIDIVLDKIFGFYNRWERTKLLGFRKVCRKWDQIVLQKLLRFNNSWTVHQKNLEDYSNYLETSPGLIFPFIRVSITKNFSIDSKVLQNFLWKWGHTLRKLEFTWLESGIGSRIPDPGITLKQQKDLKPGEFLKVLMLILEHCTNLEKLSLEGIPGVYLKSGFKVKETGIKELIVFSYIKAPVEEINNFAQDLINSCPFLQKLIWSDFYDQPELLIRVLANSKCLPNLQEIEFYTLHSSNLRILNETGFQLRKAKFMIDNGGRIELYRFLEKQKNTMISLDIEFFPENKTFVELEFPGNEQKLRFLKLRGFSYVDLIQFSSIFPNALKLKIHCSETGMTLWKKVEELEMTFIRRDGDATVDNILTGNFGPGRNLKPLSSITGLRKLKVRLFPVQKFKRELLENIGFYATVYNLPKLELIEIEGDQNRRIIIDKFGYSETQQVKLTTVTIYDRGMKQNDLQQGLRDYSYDLKP